MARQTVTASSRSGAHQEQVWRLLSDSATYPDWGAWDGRTLEREGRPAPEGEGAIRTLRTGRVVVREKITAFDPPQRVAYRLLDGLPVKGYEAEATLAPAAEGGTAIRWRASFEPRFPVPGFLVRRRLQSVFDDVVERLAEAAEREA